MTLPRREKRDRRRHTNDAAVIAADCGDVADAWLHDLAGALNKKGPLGGHMNDNSPGIKMLRTIAVRIERIEQEQARQPKLDQRLRHLENEIIALAARRHDPNEPDRRTERQLAKAMLLINQTARALAAVADFLGDEAAEIEITKLCRLAGVART